MPKVQVNITIAAPIDKVWAVLKDIESYPDLMEEVQAVEVLSESEDNTRTSAWSVLLDDSVLEWKEQERIDNSRRTVTFDQLDGDLRVFTGTWSVQQTDDEKVLVRLDAEFDIGIPLLAELLNPVAAHALRQNFEQILRHVEQQSVSGSE